MRLFIQLASHFGHYSVHTSLAVPLILMTLQHHYRLTLHHVPTTTAHDQGGGGDNGESDDGDVMGDNRDAGDNDGNNGNGGNGGGSNGDGGGNDDRGSDGDGRYLDDPAWSVSLAYLRVQATLPLPYGDSLCGTCPCDTVQLWPTPPRRRANPLHSTMNNIANSHHPLHWRLMRWFIHQPLPSLYTRQDPIVHLGQGRGPPPDWYVYSRTCLL